MEGSPQEDGLLQQIKPHQVAFKKAIRSTAPDFRVTPAPRQSGTTMLRMMANGKKFADGEDGSPGTFKFLANEEDRTTLSLNNQCPIYLDEVMKRADR